MILSKNLVVILYILLNIYNNKFQLAQLTISLVFNPAPTILEI